MDKHTHENGHEQAERLRQEASFDEAQARRLEEEARVLRDRAHELEDEALVLEDEGDGGGGGHGHDRHTVKFVISANGEPVTFESGMDEPLVAVRAKALELSRNVGRPADDWDLKDEAGNVLDVNRLVRDCHFGREAFLFLSLKAGAAGDR